MFFFIGGIQPRTVRVDKQPRPCPSCGHSTVYLQRVDHYIAIFFIPLIPIKKGVPFLACDHCHVVLDRDGTGSESEFGRMNGRRKCGYCGKPVETDFSYCPYCGRVVDVRP